jgi:hypothetical protein
LDKLDTQALKLRDELLIEGQQRRKQRQAIEVSLLGLGEE